MTSGSLRSLHLPASVATWMAEHSPVERRIATTLAILVAAATLWILLWQPMTRDVASMRTARSANAAALAEARAMAKEMSEFARVSQRGSPSGAPTDARADLERVLAQQNLRPAVTSLDWRNGRAHLVLTAVGYDALVVALDALQRDARLRAVEATLTARVDPGTVRAELTLAR